MRIIITSAILMLLGNSAFADDPISCGPAGLVNQSAIEHAVWARGSTNPVKVVKICGTYAKAEVQDLASGSTETAFLKKSAGQWTVLDEGAAPDPEKLGVPKEAW